MTKFEEIIAKLPDGCFWLTGETFAEIMQAIAEDRAILAPGCGDEVPTPNGRQFNVRPASGGGLATVYIGIAGVVRLAGFRAVITEEEEP